VPVLIQPLSFPRIFKNTQARTTALSIGHSVATAVAGAAPLAAAALVAATGNTAAPAFLMISTAVVSLVAVGLVGMRSEDDDDGY